MSGKPNTTKTDAAGDRHVDDTVVRLRRWGSDQVYLLPAANDNVAGGEWIIGSAETCWMTLADPQSRVSRRHAALVRERDRWTIRDLGSKNGMKIDGAPCNDAVLSPGLEVWLGGVTLVAESTRSAALRAFLARILGWSPARAQVVDLALRSVRMASARRSALVICGEDDVVSIARSLHRRALGAERPFVVCDPRRKRAEANVRNAQNHADGMPAFAAATHGTLCVWSSRLPRDFADVKAALVDPDARVNLVVCARDAAEAEVFGAVPIAVPALDTRKDEIERIVFEYAGDAAGELGLASTAFTRRDREWVLQHETGTLPEIEKAAIRLLAIRSEDGNLSRAALRLGMARMSLYKWIGRRKLPVVLRE